MKQERLEIALLYASYFLLGFALLSLEVVWGRMTALPLGSSIHAYSITLAAVMAGLFCGTWHGNQVSTTAGPGRLFVYMLLFALSAGITSICFVYLSEIFKFWRFLEPLSIKAAYYATLGQVSLLVFIPSLFCGAVFPIATQLLVPDVQHAGRTAGTLYMMNSLGAISGCLLTGFILIDQFGLRNTAILCATLPALPALLFFFVTRSLPGSVAALAIITLLPLGIQSAQFPTTPFSLYVSRISDSRAEFERGVSRLRVIEERESIHGITRVMQGERKFLQVNNKNESSFMGHDLPTQALLALLPRIYLGRDPDSFLDVGLGTGTTLWVAHKWAARLDSIEINPDVYEMFASHFFPALKTSPKVNFISAEARFHLANSEDTYDIVVLEPSYPTDGVTASLYTRESFAELKASLNDDGILGLFIPYHVLGPTYSGGVVRTLLTEFPFVHIWNVNDGLDIILIASIEPFRLKPDEVMHEVTQYQFPRVGHLADSLAFAQPNETIDDIRTSDEYPIYTDDVITLELAAIDGFLD
jgi:SAM-dependent methyltransferase